MATALKKIRPKVFLAENRKGLLLWKNGLAIDTIINDFKQCGYKVEYQLFNVADYGVPQFRERVIIVGVRDDIKKQIEWPKPIHSDNPLVGLLWVSAEAAIKDLENDEKAKQLPNSGYSKAKKNNGQGNRIIKANYPAHLQ